MVDGRFCFPLSSPSRLNAIANLFGVRAVDVNAASILEIGCANGGNIIPLAARYPKSNFMGVDPSDEKIKSAKQNAEDLDLKNVQFQNEKILDLEFGSKTFDYVIAPRIYSWSSESEQERLFEILQNILTPNGVAFVAYNTLPGWASVQTLRDMMIFHGRNFTDPQEQAIEARRMLEFVSENFSVNNSPYKELLETEIGFLDNAPYDVVIDDYLGSINSPSYFYKFIEKANEKGLAYLADSDLPSMYLGNQTQKAAETLKDIGDIVRQEQYVDFLNHRRYRSTLLVRDTASINRDLSTGVLEELRFIPTYRPSESIEENRNNTIDELGLVNILAPERTASISGKILCKCYLELLKSSPVPQSLEEITLAAFTALTGVTKDEIGQVLKENVFNFIFRGLLLITTDHRGFGSARSDRPEVFKVARLDALNRNVVPNLRHEMIELSDDQRILVQYCTGENSKGTLVEAIKNNVLNGDLSIAIDGVSISAEADHLEEHLAQYVDAQLNIFESAALLVTPG